MTPKRLVLAVLACAVVGGLLLALPKLQSSPVAERIGVSARGRVEKTATEWRSLLTPEQYFVTRQKGTERAFSGAYWDNHEDGVYACACCGQPLFDAKAKYDSGTGWPSFWDPVDPNNVSLIPDDRGFIRRTEVVCSRCDAHLGHVFSDGPLPTGLRYCMNSAALRLRSRNGATP